MWPIEDGLVFPYSSLLWYYFPDGEKMQQMASSADIQQLAQEVRQLRQTNADIQNRVSFTEQRIGSAEDRLNSQAANYQFWEQKTTAALVPIRYPNTALAVEPGMVPARPTEKYYPAYALPLFHLLSKAHSAYTSVKDWFAPAITKNDLEARLQHAHNQRELLNVLRTQKAIKKYSIGLTKAIVANQETFTDKIGNYTVQTLVVAHAMKYYFDQMMYLADISLMNDEVHLTTQISYVKEEPEDVTDDLIIDIE